MLTDIEQDTTIEIVAIKRGQVLSTTSNLDEAESRNASKKHLNLVVKSRSTAGKVVLDFYPDKVEHVIGLDLALAYKDSEVSYKNLTFNSKIKSNWVVNDEQQEKLQLSWVADAAQTLSPAETLFSIEFNKNNLKDGEFPSLELAKDLVSATLYDKSLQGYAIDLKKELDTNRNYLGDAIPNPAKGQSIISFVLSTKSTVDLSITNAVGKRVFQVKQVYQAGTHQIPISLSDYPSGTYYYSLKTANDTFTKKLILLDN